MSHSGLGSSEPPPVFLFFLISRTSMKENLFRSKLLISFLIEKQIPEEDWGRFPLAVYRPGVSYF
jgi:hypothetical protein